MFDVCMIPGQGCIKQSIFFPPGKSLQSCGSKKYFVKHKCQNPKAKETGTQNGAKHFWQVNINTFYCCP